MSTLARNAFVVLGISGAAIAASAIIITRQTDMGRAAARATVQVPLAERVRVASGEDPAIEPFPILGTRAWIEGADGTIVERDLPWAAFALEAGQSLDPRIEPGPFAAVIEVTFRPRGDALGRLGASLSGMRMILERAGATDDLHVDAAAARTRESLSGDPVWVRTPVERLDYTLRRTRDVGASFRAIRRPFDRSQPQPLPSAGRPVRAIGPGGEPAAALDAWPAADDPFPVDALIGALDRGRCTDCHWFHARRPVPGRPGADTGAPDLAEASLSRAIAQLADGMDACDDRARAIGLTVPDLGPPATTGIATLLVQSAGRLPSSEAAAAAAAAEEAAEAAEAAADDAAAESASPEAPGPAAPDPASSESAP